MRVILRSRGLLYYLITILTSACLRAVRCVRHALIARSARAYKRADGVAAIGVCRTHDRTGAAVGACAGATLVHIGAVEGVDAREAGQTFARVVAGAIDAARGGQLTVVAVDVALLRALVDICGTGAFVV